jgi:hypothetical protein
LSATEVTLRCAQGSPEAFTFSASASVDALSSWP